MPIRSEGRDVQEQPQGAASRERSVIPRNMKCDDRTHPSHASRNEEDRLKRSYAHKLSAIRTKRKRHRAKTKARVSRECSKWRCVGFGFWQRTRYSIYFCHVPRLPSFPSITVVPKFFQRTDTTCQKRCCRCQGRVKRAC